MYTRHTISRRQRENLPKLRFFTERSLDIETKNKFRAKKTPFCYERVFLNDIFQSEDDKIPSKII